MAKIRLLVVDDSEIVRKVIKDAFQNDPNLEVGGVAPNGAIALTLLSEIQPDLVILDVEMPEMGGLEVLTEIRKRDSKLPVIMLSTLTSLGARATLEAMVLGANAYVTKPANLLNLRDAQTRLINELTLKIKLFNKGGSSAPASAAPPVKRTLPAPAVPPAPFAAPPRPARFSAPPANHARVDVVVIGTSMGGPDALSKLMPMLPTDLPVPILVVQHMPPVFTKSLATQLNFKSAISVAEATGGERVTPGEVRIAPGDFHLTVLPQKGYYILETNQLPPENSCRPAVDVLFRSVAKFFGPNVLAVVLTGMGQDGLIGCEMIRAAGGQVLAQDEATSVVWGMPGAVSRAGLAHANFPIDQMAAEIVKRVQVGR